MSGKQPLKQDHSINSQLPPPAPTKSDYSLNSRITDASSNLLHKRNSKETAHGRVGLSGVGRLIMGQNSGSTRSLSRDVSDVKADERIRNSHSREGRKLKSKNERDASQAKRKDYLAPDSKFGGTSPHSLTRG